MLEAAQRLDADQGRPSAATTRATQYAGKVAVLPIWGVLEQHGSLLMEFFGGVSTDSITAKFKALLEDPGVSAIVLDVDSPGGSIAGVTELSDVIYKARGRKPVTAISNSLMASAAYWIASAAEELVVTPSGEVGSIGVVTAHTDLSGMMAQDGIKVTLIAAGQHKTDGNPYEPLKEEARANIQERVNQYYDMFVGTVARNRGVSADAVRNGYGEGRVVGARKAVRLGMVDRVDTLEATIARLAKSPQTVRLSRTNQGAIDGQAAAADLEYRRRRLRAAAR